MGPAANRAAHVRLFNPFQNLEKEGWSGERVWAAQGLRCALTYIQIPLFRFRGFSSVENLGTILANLSCSRVNHSGGFAVLRSASPDSFTSLVDILTFERCLNSMRRLPGTLSRILVCSWRLPDIGAIFLVDGLFPFRHRIRTRKAGGCGSSLPRTAAPCLTAYETTSWRQSRSDNERAGAGH
jgi:hypothetical protein